MQGDPKGEGGRVNRGVLCRQAEEERGRAPMIAGEGYVMG